MILMVFRFPQRGWGQDREEGGRGGGGGGGRIGHCHNEHAYRRESIRTLGKHGFVN